MEYIISFIAGFILMAIVTVFVVKAAKRKTESTFIVERTRLESDLKHANEVISEQEKEIEKTKADGQSQMAEAKEEWRKQSEKDIATNDAAHEKVIAEKDAAHEKAMNDMKTLFDETIKNLKSQMKADTEDILKNRQNDLTKTNKTNMEEIVNPLKDKIAKLQDLIDQGGKDQARLSGEMRGQIESLMSQNNATIKSAEELTNALRHQTKVQGNWGEVVLSELLESHGLTEGIHFDTQDTIRDASGKTIKNEDDKRMIPDVILHLDNIREVIIDSKVSLTAFTDYVNAENEDDREKFLKKHVESIRKHVDELAKKEYSSYIRSPKVSAGYVIMFVPTMGALWTALNYDPKLWREAADKNVLITDEQSLYGALKIVEMTWTQIAQSQNHEKVYELANEMIKRVGMFLKSYEKIGTALEVVRKAYEDGLGKLGPNGQSITTSANKLIDLGAKNDTKYRCNGQI